MAMFRILPHRRIQGRKAEASLLGQQSSAQDAGNCVKDNAKEDLGYSAVVKFRKL
jgi:hypothetical protein